MPVSKDPIRDDRIRNEIIVDCYNNEEDENMSWFYYMTENLEFPIKATVKLPLRGGKTTIVDVKIVAIDPKSEVGHPIRMGIVEKGSERVQYISPENITQIKTSSENIQIINDWLYWQHFTLLPE